MTFRLDSDIHMPYGRIAKNAASATSEAVPDDEDDLNAYIAAFGEANKTDVVGTKSKAVAWFVSNCDTPSNRMEYVRSLQRHVNVDIYGACGHLKCERSREADCWKQIEDDYYFYLAFENSICTDYVTEKFFNAIAHKVVPVVLGGYDYEKHTPARSVINAYKEYKVNCLQLFHSVTYFTIHHEAVTVLTRQLLLSTRSMTFSLEGAI